jgi:hypothetical protein
VKLRFKPEFSQVAAFPGHASITELAAEIGVYSASHEFVRTRCGPIANRILDQVPESYYRHAIRLGLLLNIDIRIHRLYPGDFPAYPGWHCDGEFRADYHAQPDLSKMPTHQHLTATVSTDQDGVSNTLFVAENLDFETDNVPTSANTLWGQVHEAVEARPDLALHLTRDGELTMFDSWTLHKATAARVRGWRLFFRMSMWHKPYLGDGGMISRQEQVYKLCEGSGW